MCRFSAAVILSFVIREAVDIAIPAEADDTTQLSSPPVYFETISPAFSTRSSITTKFWLPSLKLSAHSSDSTDTPSIVILPLAFITF